ncbi:hypothetical protein ABZ793_06230 [Micromonospora sp. NPDC047465]|uniref:hypothetical protein n=1 Tax=Micromonospora sp. NPDC047465 TaxID=3154813 RepID=UPI0033CB648C
MWISVGDGRWDYTADEDRHLLFLDGGVFAEYHGPVEADGSAWVHRYQAAAEFDQSWPLNTAEHIDTVRLETAAESDEHAWAVLAQAVAVNDTGVDT